MEPDSFQTRFARVIRLYEDVFETEATVREFHPSRLTSGDIVADFFDAAGIADINCSAWDPVSSNESISPEVLLALDLARKELVPDTPRVTYRFAESNLREICNFWSHTTGVPIVVHPTAMEPVGEDTLTIDADEEPLPESLDRLTRQIPGLAWEVLHDRMILLRGPKEGE